MKLFRFEAAGETGVPYGVCLCWRLTLAGQDVVDGQGWTCGAPTLSPQELDAALQLALGEELAVAS